MTDEQFAAVMATLHEHTRILQELGRGQDVLRQDVAFLRGVQQEHSRMLQRLTDDAANLKDESTAVKARLDRFEGTIEANTREVRSLAMRYDRMEDRMRRIEDKVP